MFAQIFEVFQTILERNRPETDHVKPKIPALAKLARQDHVAQIAIGPATIAHVDSNFLVAAHRRNGPLLEGAEQLALEFEFQFPDLVEKQRAAIGGAEVPSCGAVSPRESPSDVPEQMRGEKRPVIAAQSTAMKGPSSPRTPAMDGPRGSTPSPCPSDR